MNIDDACKTVRRWADLMATSGTGRSVPGGLPEAVAVVKAYLEREKADGRSIRELEIADELVATHQGIQWVMPFVLSAEFIEASKRRKTLS